MQPQRHKGTEKNSSLCLCVFVVNARSPSRLRAFAVHNPSALRAKGIRKVEYVAGEGLLEGAHSLDVCVLIRAVLASAMTEATHCDGDV